MDCSAIALPEHSQTINAAKESAGGASTSPLLASIGAALCACLSSNTNYELLAKIKDEYGGILHRKRKQIKSWKPFCSLKWSNRQARLLLERIGPYIVLKRQQLDLAMKFLALRNDPDRFCFSTVPAPPLSRWNSATRSVRNISHAMLEKEAAIKESMHALNRKGVSVDAIQ